LIDAFHTRTPLRDGRPEPILRLSAGLPPHNPDVRFNKHDRPTPEVAHSHDVAMTIAAVSLTKFEDRSFADPLSSEHRRELSAARGRARVIRKAARVAAFNGWTTAIIAALSAPFSIFSPVGLALTVGLAVVAVNEFRGRKRLLQFDPRAAALLGWNQIGLLAMISVYCAWMWYSSINGSGAVADELKSYADLDAALGSTGGFESLYKQIVVALYGGVIALSAVFQGGTALYYFSRRRHVEEFVADTPAWVRDIQIGTLPA
jgi:hypothetical protein